MVKRIAEPHAKCKHPWYPSVPFYNYAPLFRRLRPVLKAEGSRIEGLMVGPGRRTITD